MQNDTLIKGWWGVISFFANFLAIVTNWNNNQNLQRLGAPHMTPKTFLAPRSSPLAPGPPLRRRAGPWVTLGVFIVVALAIGGNVRPTPTNSANSTVPPATACLLWNTFKVARAQGPVTDAEIQNTFDSLRSSSDSELAQAAKAAISAAASKNAAGMNAAFNRIDFECSQQGS